MGTRIAGRDATRINAGVRRMARRSSLKDWERHELQRVLEGKHESYPGHSFFKPSTDLAYLPFNFDNEASLFRLSDEQVGAVMRRLVEYAHGYAKTFDEALLPDDAGLSEGAAMMLSVLAGFVRRQYDIDRVIAFSRTSGGHEILQEIRRQVRDQYDEDEED